MSVKLSLPDIFASIRDTCFCRYVLIMTNCRQIVLMGFEDKNEINVEVPKTKRSNNKEKILAWHRNNLLLIADVNHRNEQ